MTGNWKFPIKHVAPMYIEKWQFMLKRHKPVQASEFEAVVWELIKRRQLVDDAVTSQNEKPAKSFSLQAVLH